MAIDLTPQEAAILSQMAYMDIKDENIKKYEDEGFTLKDVAKDLLDKRDNAIKEGKEPPSFSGWGGTTDKEQYDMLQAISDGKYKDLSNLKIKDYQNNEGENGFVAYAFTDGNGNVICAFRGTMGTRVGQDSTSEQIKGFTNSSWTNNYDLGLNDASLQFASTKAFVERNMEPGGETFVTGHSQGAGNAAYACAVIPGVTGFAFDGPGIGQALTPTQREQLVNSGFINCVK